MAIKSEMVMVMVYRSIYLTKIMSQNTIGQRQQIRHHNFLGVIATYAWIHFL